MSALKFQNMEKIMSKNNLISSVINGKCNFGIVEFGDWFIELN